MESQTLVIKEDLHSHVWLKLKRKANIIQIFRPMIYPRKWSQQNRAGVRQNTKSMQMAFWWNFIHSPISTRMEDDSRIMSVINKKTKSRTRPLIGWFHPYFFKFSEMLPTHSCTIDSSVFTLLICCS
mmetsp:Transcript_8819/g.11586  ORF Transcript_8819/g.11586 Transcript_8819/m.11586 type:complete len:127 (-) Transcript_8819:249-629(-)